MSSIAPYHMAEVDASGHSEVSRKRIAELEAAIDTACDVFVEPFGSKNPDKTVGDWRVEMLNAMRELRRLVPKATQEN